MEIEQPGGGGSALTVTDGLTTVNNVNDITFIGATVSNGGSGIADVTISTISTANLIGTTNQVLLSASGNGVLVGNTNITLSLPQNIDTSANPTFATVNLGGVASQLVFASNSSTPGTLTWTPSISSKTITLPNVTGTVITTGNLTSITATGTIVSGTWNADKIGLAYGGTNADLSGTGGTSQVLKQTSVGGVITVAQLAASDLSNGVQGSGAVVLAVSPTITTAALGSSTATTQTPADNSTKVATTAYVDNAVLGQRQKEAVKYASITALPTIIYANGSSGVGATITGFSFGAIGLDSAAPAIADRVLIKNQASDFQNGIYVVTATGSVGAVFVLTRATDFDQASDIQTGDTVFVTAGTTLANTTWTYNGIDSPTMGTTSLTFVQASGPGSYTQGNGITITGVSIAIDTSVTVDKTTAQALTNKTITSSTNLLGGVTMSLGSDAVGDIYAATTSNVLSRIAAVATGQVLISKGTTTLPAWSASPTVSNILTTNNAVTASGNAATVPVTSFVTTVTNNSAATLTITITTAGAVDRQRLIVCVLDASAVAQTITWVNTENSATSVPTTSNGSTTLPITVGFMYNNATSKWRCVASS